MKRRVAEMESEAAKLREMQSHLDTASDTLQREDREDVDARSIFVGNVDYSATPEEIQNHFSSGPNTINRVTILLDKFTGHPKGWVWDFPVQELGFYVVHWKILQRHLCYLARDGLANGMVRRYAYVEFSEPDLVTQALVLNESLFRGRNLKVSKLSEEWQNIAHERI
jgi:polyadenylate-binding protein 2